MKFKLKDPGSAITHGIALLLAAVGAVPLIIKAARSYDVLHIVALSIFILTMVLLYAASTIYHSVDSTEKVNRRLRKMDHMMIFVMIAGSYTPFCVVLLPQPRGTQFCLILWGVALAGVLAKMLWINAPRMLSTAVYLIMGWSVVFVAKDFTALGQPCLTLVALGGICYSVGAVFYAVKKPNISAEWTFHELFHLLILAGSFFHYLAVYLYVL